MNDNKRPGCSLFILVCFLVLIPFVLTMCLVFSGRGENKLLHFSVHHQYLEDAFYDSTNTETFISALAERVSTLETDEFENHKKRAWTRGLAGYDVIKECRDCLGSVLSGIVGDYRRIATRTVPVTYHYYKRDENGELVIVDGHLVLERTETVWEEEDYWHEDWGIRGYHPIPKDFSYWIGSCFFCVEIC